MTDRPMVPSEVVLVDEHVDPDFHAAVLALGDTWTAPSGRQYRIVLSGSVLVVSWPSGEHLVPVPPGEQVDEDLLALAQAIYRARGGEWAEVDLERLAEVWSGATRPELHDAAS